MQKRGYEVNLFWKMKKVWDIFGTFLRMLKIKLLYNTNANVKVLGKVYLRVSEY